MQERPLSGWISVVANLGVLIGLVLVAYEVHQNTTQLRRAEMNATHEQISVWRHALIENQDLAEIWEIASRSPKDLTPAQRIRLDLALQELFWTNWQYWDRARVGAIELSWAHQALDGTAYLLEVNPAAREWWERNRGQFNVEYRTAIEARVPNTALEPPLD